MLDKLVATIDASEGTATTYAVFGKAETDLSTTPYPIPNTMPLSIDAGQAYYWSYAWQAGEQESREDLANGLAKSFENAQDAIRWILSDED